MPQKSANVLVVKNFAPQALVCPVVGAVFDPCWPSKQMRHRHIFENLCKKQLHDSEELKPHTELYMKHTVQKGEATKYSRLKDMVRRYVEQKMGGDSLNSLNEERSLQ